MFVVFTIGHSTRTWKIFLGLLRAHGIKRVIDVRSIPCSRHNPQFNRETLSAKLRSARIGYVHLRKLGGLRHARRDSPNMGWRNTSFRGFNVNAKNWIAPSESVDDTRVYPVSKSFLLG